MSVGVSWLYLDKSIGSFGSTLRVASSTLLNFSVLGWIRRKRSDCSTEAIEKLWDVDDMLAVFRKVNRRGNLRRVRESEIDSRAQE